MKFTIILDLFFTLITVTSVYGAAIVEYHQYQDRCRAELDEYEICVFPVVGIPADHVKQCCNNFFHRNKCQNFYSNPKDVVPSCYLYGSSEKYSLLNNLNENKLLLDLICSSCPISSFFLNPSINKSSFFKLVKKNCISRYCNHILKQYLPYIIKEIKTKEHRDYYTSILNYLSSDQCKNGGRAVSTTAAPKKNKRIIVTTTK